MRALSPATERIHNGYLVDEAPGCWLWQRRTGWHGYGRIKEGGRWLYAHRVSYEARYGPVPDGLTLDHLCRVRHCVNPDHLEPVTTSENFRRGMTPSLVAHRTNRCMKGLHSLDDAIVTAKGRECRHCRRDTRLRKKVAA